MSQSIDNAFVQQFERDVHLAYQRMGSKLSNMVRKKVNVKGESTTFQRVGKGAAGTKTRHGNVPTMSLQHDPIKCFLEDHYAADYIDKLDELKINHDERMVVAQSAAGAMGRKSDDIILTAMEATTEREVETGTDPLATSASRAKIEKVFQQFGDDDVPDDGERYWVVSPSGWIDLLTQDAFSNADYVGTDDLPFKGGMTAKRWLGFMWVTFSGLRKTGAGKRKSYAFHRSAIGHASGQDVKTEIGWITEKQAHMHVSSMSQGAVLIDAKGCYEMQYHEA